MNSIFAVGGVFDAFVSLGTRIHEHLPELIKLMLLVFLSRSTTKPSLSILIPRLDQLIPLFQLWMVLDRFKLPDILV